MHHFNLYLGILQIHLKSAIINFRKGLQGHFIKTFKFRKSLHRFILYHFPTLKLHYLVSGNSNI